MDDLSRASSPPWQGEKLKISWPDVERIVRANGAAMISHKSIPSDVSELPYPKHLIKAALIAAISVTKDPKMREQLKSGFVTLGDWQEGVAALGPDPFLHMMTLGEDIREDAKRISERGNPVMELRAKGLAECKELLDELNALGL